jgi:hypothetical protein
MGRTRIWTSAAFCIAAASLAYSASAKQEQGKVSKIKLPSILCMGGASSTTEFSTDRSTAERSAIAAWVAYTGSKWDMAKDKGVSCKQRPSGGWDCTATGISCINPRNN